MSYAYDNLGALDAAAKSALAQVDAYLKKSRVPTTDPKAALKAAKEAAIAKMRAEAKKTAVARAKEAALDPSNPLPRDSASLEKYAKAAKIGAAVAAVGVVVFLAKQAMGRNK
jgi:hypothetical protein